MIKKSQPAQEAAEQTIARLQKKFGKEAAINPIKSTPLSVLRGVIRSGVDVVDRFVCGCGGIPRGRITEIYSEPGVCKTSFGWTLLGGCARAGGLAIYCDSERSYDPERASMFIAGGDMQCVILLQPLLLEDALSSMQSTLEDMAFAGPILLLWDSLAGATFLGDTTGGYEKMPRDDRAMKIGSWSRAINSLVVRKQAALVIVNQERKKRGLVFGNDSTTPGGDGPKYLTSLRIQLFNGKALKDKAGLHVGKTVTFMAVKSRFSPPFRKAKVRLDYLKGWDNLWSTINHAKDLKFVPDSAKYTKDTYQAAITALKWEDAAQPFETVVSGDEVQEEELE